MQFLSACVSTVLGLLIIAGPTSAQEIAKTDKEPVLSESDVNYESIVEVEERELSGRGYRTVVDILESKRTLSTLLSLLEATKLDDVLETDGPFTVFAPKDNAFRNTRPEVKKFAEDIDTWEEHLQLLLLSHVVSPDKLEAANLKPRGKTFETVNNDFEIEVTDPFPDVVKINDRTKVVNADLKADNGIVHVIKKVLLPPFVTMNVVDKAISLPDVFSTLVDLVVKADLVEPLSGPGPFTVFAPTNDAFRKLPRWLLTKLAKRENKHKLIELLTYHVVAGNIFESDIGRKQYVETLEGSKVLITKWRHGSIKINFRSKVIKDDVVVSNGVIHVIDRVLIPPVFFWHY